ncbi:Retroviral aspartyl protease [Corchorus olitorius]|uniref:Retroviral aspartyl protease n=1 Tax=Corchorus olitorius TaxID=93759 RepID=A0A1R3GEY9_9ROSI|nr:Retroviral aspartyl protease [Corchorus olitorius]
MAPKVDTATVDALNAIAEPFNAKIQELHQSQETLKQSLEANIDSSLTNLCTQLSTLHASSSPRFVKFLGLPIEPPPSLVVRVGNDEVMRCSGAVSGLNVELQGLRFNLYLFLLDVHEADIILGVPWLAQLVPILADFSLLCMSFRHNGKWVSLVGHQLHRPDQLTDQQVQQLSQNNSLHSAHLLTLEDAKQSVETSRPRITLKRQKSKLEERKKSKTSPSRKLFVLGTSEDKISQA